MPTIKIDTLLESVTLELFHRGHTVEITKGIMETLVLYLADKVEEFYDEQR